MCDLEHAIFSCVICDATVLMLIGAYSAATAQSRPLLPLFVRLFVRLVVCLVACLAESFLRFEIRNYAVNLYFFMG